LVDLFELYDDARNCQL